MSRVCRFDFTFQNLLVKWFFIKHKILNKVIYVFLIFFEKSIHKDSEFFKSKKCRHCRN